MNDRISVASKTYIRMEIKTKGINPTSDPLQCGLSLSFEIPPTIWATGTWVAEAGKYWAYLLVGPGSTYGAVTPNRYWQWSKVTDNAELVLIPSANPLKFM